MQPYGKSPPRLLAFPTNFLSLLLLFLPPPPPKKKKFSLTLSINIQELDVSVSAHLAVKSIDSLVPTATHQ